MNLFGEKRDGIQQQWTIDQRDLCEFLDLARGDVERSKSSAAGGSGMLAVIRQVLRD